MKQNPKPLKNKHPKTPHKPATGNMQAGFVYYTKKIPLVHQGNKSICTKQERTGKVPKDAKVYFSTICAPGHFCQTAKKW